MRHVDGQTGSARCVSELSLLGYSQLYSVKLLFPPCPRPSRHCRSQHRIVATSCHGLHESLGPRLCNGSQVVDQLVLGHANARVLNGQGRVGLVRNDLDEEVGLSLHSTRLIILDNCRPSSQEKRRKTRSNHSSHISFSISFPATVITSSVEIYS